MPISVNKIGELAPGDLFEDCRFHPCLCIEAATLDDPDGISGISLVDGTPCNCNIYHCGLRKLTVEEAIQWKYHGPRDETVEDRWWKRWPQVGDKPSQPSPG